MSESYTVLGAEFSKEEIEALWDCINSEGGEALWDILRSLYEYENQLALKPVDTSLDVTLQTIMREIHVAKANQIGEIMDLRSHLKELMPRTPPK